MRRFSTSKNVALACTAVILLRALSVHRAEASDIEAVSTPTRTERVLRSEEQTLQTFSPPQYGQVGMASLVDPGSRIQVCKVDVTDRASCGDFLGNMLPCPLSPGFRGVVNYTVAQGDSLTVNFNTNSSSTVIMGGAPNGGFARDPPCQVAGKLGPAPQQPIALNTITGFTFAPTRAVCPSFVNNTEGQMSVYMFDSSNGSANRTNGHYLASACRFQINLTIQKAADAPIQDDQFYYGNSQMSLG